MVDGPIRSYQFAATGAPALRSLADRYGLDRVNVKEFDAKGDGVTDDSDAIQAAIEYAMFLHANPYGGAVVFMPRGTYFLAKPIILGKSPNWGGGKGTFQLVGSSRSGTRIVGNWAGGTAGGISYYPFLVQKDPRDGNYDAVSNISHMTILNASQSPGSGGIMLQNLMTAILIDSCDITGDQAISMGDTFGSYIVSCRFFCSSPINGANSASPGPAPGSVAVHTFQTQIISCQADGFDIGYALGGPGTLLIASRGSRCNTGVYGGVVSDYSSGHDINTASCILANRLDRCTKGMWMFETGYATIGGNIISGNEGPAAAAAIQGITFGGGSGSVSMTAPHNLPIGFVGPLVLVTNPASMTPDGTGRQIVTATRTGANTFSYPQGGASGSFVSGSWNYPLQYAMQMRTFDESFAAANLLSAVVSASSFDMTNAGNQGVQFNNYIAAMQGPYGWNPPPNGYGVGAGWQFVNCGMAGKSPPVAFMQYRDLPGESGVYQNGAVGAEYTIINADTVGFGGVVTATGGTNRYKVRYNGVAWTRAG